MKCLVFDIGGTNFRVGLYDRESGNLENTQRFETPNYINRPHLDIHALQEELIKTIISKVNEYQRMYPNITNIGVSFPAALTSQGITHKVPTIWGKTGANFPLLAILKKRMPTVRWTIANDITAAAERYGSLDLYKDIDYLCIVTVSSGIGSKIYDNNNKCVVLDLEGIGGELGHSVYDYSDNAPICECGGRGHLASFSSGRAIETSAKIYAELHPHEYNKSTLHSLCTSPSTITNRDIVTSVLKGDDLATHIVSDSTIPLVKAINILNCSIGIGKFIFIGGFASNLGNHYLSILRDNLKRVNFYSLTSEQVDKLVDIGFDDDNDSLIGIGILSSNKYLV